MNPTEEESEARYKPSPAVTYESLRQRLASTVGRAPNPSSSFAQRPATEPSETESVQDAEFSTERSGSTAAAFRNLNPEALSFDPPDATSTPMHSLQLPSELQLQSSASIGLLSHPAAYTIAIFTDLLSQDSEMQNAMNELDTFGGDTTANRTQRRCMQFCICFSYEDEAYSELQCPFPHHAPTD